ncbi:MAG: LuxR C-terminal-related transcriptional regulator [Alphaproteobacteria bacterium]|nr:LuxR C-terminal-related transcriptional regulator [Alphaproteobacteria bacterium]
MKPIDKDEKLILSFFNESLVTCQFMQKTKIYLPQEIYTKHLETVNGVRFTPREIEVIVYILSGRTAKAISSFLSVSPKTIETHIRNIMMRLECNSKEGIINFIEKSYKLSYIKQYHLCLLAQNSFEKFLKEIPSLMKEKVIKCGLIYWHGKNEHKFFIDCLKNHLQIAGIQLLIESKEGENFTFDPIKSLSSHQIDYMLYSIPDLLIKKLNNKSDSEKVELSHFIQKTSRTHNKVIFLLLEKNNIKEYFPNVDVVDLLEGENYYFSVFDILKKLLFPININNIISEFKKQCQVIYGSAEVVYKPPLLKNSLTKRDNFLRTLIKFLNFKAVKSRLALLSVLSISFFCVGFLIFKENKTEEIKYDRKEVVRSDLLIPNDHAFLNRPQLITQLNEKLKTQSGIQAVALVGVVGMGGIGKTTIARQFGRLQESPVVWEINAETKNNLLNSFKSLAYRLARTIDQKNDLIFIQEIKDPDEKEKQLFYFIKSRLKENPNWILIYDNVSTFSEIKNYFPHDPTVWGIGKVIITTRNSNIGETSYLNAQHIIQMEKLTPIEALTLFSKIFYNCEPNNLSSLQQESTLKFLENIPPFPLDVSAAAYYIKNVHLTYDQYLEKIGQGNQNFDSMQAMLLNEVSDYTKTRYGILTLSFKKIIDTHPEFKELLFLICLLDSQQIPKFFLESYKSSSVVNHFIHELKKYSLATSVSEDKKNPELSAFSLHRSTQTLGKSFIIKSLSESELQEYLDKIILSSKSFYENYSKKNLQIIISLIPHLEMLLENLKDLSLSNAIKSKHRLDLFFILGYSYYREWHSLSAKKYFLQIVESPKDNKHFPDIVLATLLKDFGEVSIALNDLDQPYSQRSIDLCKNIKNSELIVAENLQIIGDSYRKKDNFEQANMYYIKALEEISNLDNKIKQVLESKIYDRLGWLYSVTYLHKKEAQRAREYLLKSLDILNSSQLFHANNKNHPQEKLPCFVAQHRLRLGVINSRLCNYKEAFKEGFREAQYIIDNSLDNCPHDIFLNARIAEGVGEMLLREGKIDQAEEKLTEAIKVIEIMVGKSITLVPKSFRVEARIRQGKLADAYEDCSAVLEIAKREKNNFHNLIYLTNFYHAAIIKYKQGDLKKSIEHFIDFFREVKKFSKSFLSEDVYETLESQKVFTTPSSNKDMAQISKDCLEKSKKIFFSIYTPSHPFIRDYVALN